MARSKTVFVKLAGSWQGSSHTRNGITVGRGNVVKLSATQLAAVGKSLGSALLCCNESGRVIGDGLPGSPAPTRSSKKSIAKEEVYLEEIEVADVDS